LTLAILAIAARFPQSFDLVSGLSLIGFVTQ